MKHAVIKQFLKDVEWGDLDFLVIDSPPGTGDEPLTVAQLVERPDGAVVVTTPSEVAQMVVKKSIVYARDVGIRIIGLIENMSGALCPECRTEVSLFQGDSAGIAEALDVPLIGRIPFDRELNQASDRGRPLLDEAHPIVRRYTEIADKIISYIDYRKILAEKL
jgi:ATP-binding protein involved in chromosome partitioning